MKTACVIGAGAAGLAAGKALADRDIDFDWFEKGSYVGGLWQIDNDNGGAAAYKTLHLNSSRPRTEYPSYPMPEDWADYPPDYQVAQYFEDFADMADIELVVIDENTTTRRFADELRYNAVVRKFTEGLR